MNIFTFLQSAFKNVDNMETYQVAKEYLEALVAHKVPTKILTLYTVFIKGYEALKASCKLLAIRVKNSPNQLDNFCLQQGLKAVKAIAEKVSNDVDDMAKLAGIEL